MGGRGGANLSAKRDVAGGGGGARADEGVADFEVLVVLAVDLAFVEGEGGGLAVTGGVFSDLRGGAFFNRVGAVFGEVGVAAAFAGTLAGAAFLEGNSALVAVLGFFVPIDEGTSLAEGRGAVFAADAALTTDFLAAAFPAKVLVTEVSSQQRYTPV